MANLEKPYFVEYLLDQEECLPCGDAGRIDVAQPASSFRRRKSMCGWATTSSTTAISPAGGFGAQVPGRFPLEGSYDLVRRYFWLATDAAYKSAVEAIARKRAALRNVAESGDRLDDFGRVAPLRPVRDWAICRSTRTPGRRGCATFRRCSRATRVKDSRVDLEANAGGYYVVNSEGTEVRVPEDVTFLRMRAMAQSADGSTVRDLASFHAIEPAGMPGEAELMAAARELAART